MHIAFARRLAAASALLAITAAVPAKAQISLATAVDLALKNSPRVKVAQADHDKAQAALREARSVYVPVVSTTGGYGQSTGAPLGVPVIFSISAQSLVFTFSQGDYIRAARASVEATEDALNETRIEIAEDTTNTYVALDNALQRRTVLQDEGAFANRLVLITGQRVSLGVDPHLELLKSQRTAVQIRLQKLTLDDEIAGLSRHLAQLTGLTSRGLTTDPASIPVFTKPQPPPEPSTETGAYSQGIMAALATARAKELVAHGDKRYLLRPQIGLAGNFSRVDANLSSYSAYYPRFAGTPDHPNSNNSLGFGLQITIPLLDMTHKARAQGSAAEAARALAEAHVRRDLFLEGRAKLRNAALELDARLELADLDQQLAQDQLNAVRVQLRADAANLSGTQSTPKDELNAQVQERQRTYDLLSARLQLQQTQVNLLRQQGGLADWIHASIPTGTGGSATPPPPQVTIPSVPSGGLAPVIPPPPGASGNTPAQPVAPGASPANQGTPGVPPQNAPPSVPSNPPSGQPGTTPGTSPTNTVPR